MAESNVCNDCTKNQWEIADKAIDEALASPELNVRVLGAIGVFMRNISFNLSDEMGNGIGELLGNMHISFESQDPRDHK